MAVNIDKMDIFSSDTGNSFPKLRKMHVIDMIGKKMMEMTDLSDECAIVDGSFVSRVCHERCGFYDCRKKEFADAGEALVVFKQCPFYVEAFMEDLRRNEK